MHRRTLLWTVLFLAGGAFLAWRASLGAGSGYVQRIGETVVAATPAEHAAGLADFSWPRTIGTWVAAFFTLAILSFLYRDNPFYKFAESVVVGVSAAYAMVVGFWTVLVPNLIGALLPEVVQSWAMPGHSPVRDERWWLDLVPLALGVMLLWRLAPKGSWISRWPLAFIIGATAGIRLVGYIQADFLSQIRNSIQPLVAIDGGFDPWGTLRSTLVVASILACLTYFFFSFEHKGALGKVARSGIWVLMITFGAMFGYTVMGRIALLAIRFEFLFDTWLWLIDPLGRRVGM
ncbi:MAG: hypothetical protein WD069_01265 [Planctomycetales bacterium]